MHWHEILLIDIQIKEEVTSPLIGAQTPHPPLLCIFHLLDDHVKTYENLSI